MSQLDGDSESVQVQQTPEMPIEESQFPLLADRRSAKQSHDSLAGDGAPTVQYNWAFVAALTFFAAIGGFLFGYDTGVVSGAMVLITPRFGLNHVEQELVVSLAVAGAILGSPLGGSISDKFGRRAVILITSVLFIASSLALAAAQNPLQLMMARTIIGIAVGGAASTIPVYLAEFAPSSVRGTIVATYNMFINGGQAIAALVDGLLVKAPGGWRWMLGLAALPAVIQFPAFVFYFDETPRWLASKGRENEARAALARTYVDTVPESHFADAERQESTGLPYKEQLREFVSSPPLRKALMLGCGLQFVQQASGINTVMYYAGTILTMAGFEATSAVWLNALVASCNFAFAPVGVYLMDRIGRRRVTLWSLAGVASSLVFLGTVFRYVEPDAVGPKRYLPVAGLCLYLASFASGMGPIPWTVNSEIYPMHVRSLGASIATSVNWSSNLLISASFLTLVDVVGRAGAFYAYSTVAIVGWLLLYRALPETKGKTLEEIQQVFAG